MTDREIDALEQDAENTRTRVSGLLDELRGRVSPGEMVDQMVSYASDGAGEAVRTLGNQLRNNPLPALLIGVGVAWLMFSDKRGPVERKPASARPVQEPVKQARGLVAHASERLSAAYDEVGSSASRTRDSVTELGQQAVDTAYEMGNRAVDTASDLGQKAADKAADLRHRATDTASQARHSVEDIGKRALDTATQILHEQPLVAAGLGLAIGAALGAALPTTEAENKLMGSTGDDLKDRARQAAEEGYEQAREAAQDAYGTVVDTVAREVSEASSDKEFAEQHGHGPRSAGR